MLSSKERLAQKTGRHGLGRFEYLQALVTEFQDTHRQDYKQQVLANLANFAYDPINYEYFRQLNILDLFLDVVAEETDDKMVEFAIGGLCNCCLDKLNKEYILDNDGVELTIQCLTNSNEETVLSAITTLMFLVTPQSKPAITSQPVKELMRKFRMSFSTRLKNLSTIFLEDLCNETVSHFPPPLPPLPSLVPPSPATTSTTTTTITSGSSAK